MTNDQWQTIIIGNDKNNTRENENNTSLLELKLNFIQYNVVRKEFTRRRCRENGWITPDFRLLEFFLVLCFYRLDAPPAKRFRAAEI